MGGDPQMGTDHWGSGLSEEDYATEVQLIHTLAAWCKRQSLTSVDFHELVELLGLEMTLEQLLEQRSTKQR